MELLSNSKIELARELLINTRANIFLTGKAGTGKTTFLREVMRVIPKRCVVAAPTGVAAINAGGVTLHSLFQLPFGPHIPGHKSINVAGTNRFSNRISKAKLQLIRSIELLVIDEISMVRSDMLDAIDEALRRIRRSSHPFGGVQLLMIGDMKQLSPICKDDEWELLREHYDTPYFFDSQALKRSSYIGVEFDQIFRQNDGAFIEMLNAVREGRITHSTLEQLNSRYIPNFEPHPNDDYITLTTHNHTANAINRSRLEAIDSPSKSFSAKVKGDYSAAAYPNDLELELKVGAQVLFVKNDISPEKRYYNGMLGDVESINGDRVTVRPKSGAESIDVDRAVWESVEYRINSQSAEVESVVKGSFSQLPLRCAWAITIHKSQGMSFDRAIIDASGSFAHGQVYVALSRCRTLEGMVLRTPIKQHAILGDRSIDSFCEQVSTNQPCDEVVEQQRISYLLFVLMELFNFVPLQRMLWDLRSELSGAVANRNPRYFNDYGAALQQLDSEIIGVGERFSREITRRLDPTQPLNEEELTQRLNSSAGYFTPRLEPIWELCKELNKIDMGAEDRRKRVKTIADALLPDVELRVKLFELCAEGFTIDGYHKVKSAMMINDFSFEKPKKGKLPKEPKQEKLPVIEYDPQEIQSLYETLRAWRLSEAKEHKVPAFTIFNDATMIKIATSMPRTTEELLEIKGIGKAKLEQYGNQILEIIQQHTPT